MSTMGLPMDWTFVKDFKRYTFNYVRDLERYCLMRTCRQPPILRGITEIQERERSSE